MRWMKWRPERLSHLPASGRHDPTGSAGRWPANARLGYTPASTRWSMKLRTFGARWLRLV